MTTFFAALILTSIYILFTTHLHTPSSQPIFIPQRPEGMATFLAALIFCCFTGSVPALMAKCLEVLEVRISDMRWAPPEREDDP
jgi:hypothetical protein